MMTREIGKNQKKLQRRSQDDLVRKMVGIKWIGAVHDLR